MLLPLLVGTLIGLGILLALALLFGRRGAETTWRGYANAAAVGIALGAMFDLLPQALGLASVAFGLLVKSQVIDRFAIAPDSFLGIGAPILNDAVTPIGAVLVLYLYLGGNSVARTVDGALVGKNTTGWRKWFILPETTQPDWRGVALLTIGLAAQNLWLGQVRGALAANASSGFNLFFYAAALVAMLRGLALFGPLVDPARRWLVLGVCALLLGAAMVFAVIDTAVRNSIEWGVVPLFVAVLVLPLAMGRLLRSVEFDVGLHWQTTLVVLVALGIERGCSYLVLLLAQGQIG